MIRFIAFIIAFVTVVHARDIPNGAGDDVTFDPFDGSLAQSGWFIEGPASTRNIAPDELRFQESATLNGETRTGLVRMADANDDGDGNGKITYVLIASRCIEPLPPLGVFDIDVFNWQYTWGKEIEDNNPGFIAAKMILYNEASSFGVTIVNFSPNSNTEGMWIEENITPDDADYFIANMFWFGELGTPRMDMDIPTFLNDRANAADLADASDAFNNELGMQIPGLPTITFSNFADVGGTFYSLRQWVDTPTHDLMTDYVDQANVNPFAYALNLGGPPVVARAEYGIGSGERVLTAYLDESTITLGGRTYTHTFDAASTASEVDLFRCRGTCTIPRMAKREYNNIKGFRNQKLSMEGKHNDILNLVSDDHCQVNAKLGKTDDSKSTRVTLLGFSVGDEKILVGCDDKHASVVQLNGKPLASKQKFSSSSGFISLNEDGTVTVAFPLYQFKLSIVQVGTPSCHVGFNIKHWHGDHDSPPHGLLGLTVHDIGTSIQSKMDALLKDNLHDFRVSDMFSSDFKHNRYNATLSSASDLKMNQYFAKRSVFISETI